ncbi:hypothetical protein AK812_SmicGene15162 [Symbiodinium microadriaticum]|uniref:Uncharacterized protein n=1 Tax=Symbiodinium microadriaticum TaxID=2951 RepID=A0A1Q9E3Q7_SYMMI|nr:hypothetical protein AK812_SmicGene15162 [Symbiodinium microadriaticum]
MAVLQAMPRLERHYVFRLTVDDDDDDDGPLDTKDDSADDHGEEDDLDCLHQDGLVRIFNLLVGASAPEVLLKGHEARVVAPTNTWPELAGRKKGRKDGRMDVLLGGRAGRIVPLRSATFVDELGTLDVFLWAQCRDAGWKLVAVMPYGV